MSPPQMFLSLLVVLITLHAITCSTTFDCRRTGQNCKNNAPCTPNGNCSCNTTVYEGFDCGIVTENKNDTACTPSCQNDGVCELTGTAAKCICNEKYSGNNCTVKRVDVKCFGNRKIIYANPVGFAGKMYISGYPNVAECELVPVANITNKTDFKPEWTEGYVITIMDVDPNCGNITQTSDGTVITYQRSVKIEYDKIIMTTLDEVLLARCQMDNSTLRPLSVETIKTEMSNSVFKNTSTVNVYEPLVFNATSNGALLSSTPLLLGEEIEFNFNIPSETGFVSVIVESLTANDTMLAGKTLKIIENKCPVAPSVISSLTRSDDNRIVTVKMNVFKFIDSDSIGFMGSARICKDGEPDCDEKTSCTSGSTLKALGRRKRESGNELTVQKTIRVTTDPEAAKTTSTQNNNQQDNCPNSPVPEETHCLQQTEIIIVLALLAAAVLVLMIACGILTWKLLRTSPKVIDIYPPEHSSSRSLPRLSPSNF